MKECSSTSGERSVHWETQHSSLEPHNWVVHHVSAYVHLGSETTPAGTQELRPRQAGALRGRQVKRLHVGIVPAPLRGANYAC